MFDVGDNMFWSAMAEMSWFGPLLLVTGAIVSMISVADAAIFPVLLVAAFISMTWRVDK